MPLVGHAALSGLAPVLGPAIHTLILGSFPGVASLQAQRYYAHPRNQFWRLLGTVLDEPLADMAYEARLERMLARGVGLWDALEGCEREGSLDSAIRRPQANDHLLLKDLCPQLRLVCFNGKAAGRCAPVYAQAGYETLVLPSSSPANAQLSFAAKLALWQAINR
nr:DNA-deoxyinosine glycosylase [uncultured Noviherbaspirillum sp.]